ncbi:MAG TPA: radical SAM protein [Azospirillum sp.]
MKTNVVVFAEHEGARKQVEAARVCFSAKQCFRMDDGDEDVRCLRALASLLADKPGLAVYGGDDFFAYILKHEPGLRGAVQAVVLDPDVPVPDWAAGLPVGTPDALPAGIRTVFLAHLGTYPRWRMRRRLPADVAVVEPSALAESARVVVPKRAWSPIEANIYPIDIPDVTIRDSLDLLLLDCPARNLALLPNGLAHVHNALKKTSINFQTFDLDIVVYHRYHIERIFDRAGETVLESGRVMPKDPWQAEHYDIWAQPDVINHFLPEIMEIAGAIIKAKPKVLGLSIQQCNEHFIRRLVNYLKTILPDLVILVGGFSCYNAEIGRRAFPECDYMCVGEADLSVGPLVEALARGERPANMPGVLSRFDDPNVRFVPAPMPHNLDVLDFPTYEWFGVDIYRNFNGYRLVPVIASRGCRWARCTFCAERFYWRIRTATNFVDEIEWLVERGCHLFMFNESDLNGQPERLLEICDEVIRRGLKVKFTGQLRIHKACDRAYFDKLKAAGFVSLRFGVDAFSENTLRLQMKGYTKEMVSRVLRDCWEAGIYTEVNWVIGVPGETEEDCDEGVAFILSNQKYIGRMANINPLILTNGSVYWLDPDAHNVHFRAPKEQLYDLYWRAIPAHLWYSSEPYIDANVRKQRFNRIVCSLHERGFPLGPWAERIVNDVLLERDANRSSAAEKRTADNKVDVRPPMAVFAKEVGNYRIYRYAGFSYAVPAEHGELDFLRSDKLPAGVLKDLSEESLIATIEEAQGWADLRGQYDPRLHQRRKGSYMRANATLGDEEEQRPDPLELEGDELFIAYQHHHLAFAGTAWNATFADAKPGDVTVLGAHAKEFSVEFIQIYLRDYKILLFDGRYYSVPVTIERLRMDMIDEAERWGILVDRSLAAIRAKTREAVGIGRGDDADGVDGVDTRTLSRGSGPSDEFLAVPTEVGRVNGYRLVSYEGWIYGLPPELNDVDLREVDVIEMPGVIRDVARSVVEGEILHVTRRAAAGE